MRTESIFGYLTTHQIAMIMIGQDKAVLRIKEQLNKLYLEEDTIRDIIDTIDFNMNEKLKK